VKAEKPTDTDLAFLSAEELAPMLRRREISPVELAEHFLGRFEKANARLNAFITVTREEALKGARASEARFAKRAPRSLLDGIPISLKDNLWTRGIRTTAGSAILRNFFPPQNAPVVERLVRAGAVMLGKTNMHEFAYGVTSENPHYGAVHNPWDVARTPGGSSGGSAAAVAAGLCVASVGTDTGGSVRIPAALCGVVGLKPTFGRVSCFGTIPLAPSLDHVGPITRTSGDAALMLAILAGHDENDAATMQQPAMRKISSVRDLEALLKLRGARKPKFRLGWPKDYFFERVADEVRRRVDAAINVLVELGGEMEDVALPHAGDGDEPSTTIALAEATHVHQHAGWFPAHALEYGEDVRSRLQAGTEIRAADYLAALDVRERVKKDFAEALERVDAIVAPATPITAPLIGEKMVEIGDKEETSRSALIRTNRPANFTGLPAISIPCGWTNEGLPVGLQLIGPRWGEEKLLAIACLFEKAQPELRWHPAQF
jgi:aspartyl-tRNA(Asn)/glutamyl-tRNA(Gln) amidotransferase subunit A